MRDTHLKVLKPPLSSSQNPTPNVILSPSSIECVEQRIDKEIGKQVPRKWLSNELIMLQTDTGDQSIQKAILSTQYHQID